VRVVDGKVAEFWVSPDRMTIMQQIGALGEYGDNPRGLRLAVPRLLSSPHPAAVDASRKGAPTLPSWTAGSSTRADDVPV
jgi:hypothetical protein